MREGGDKTTMRNVESALVKVVKRDAAARLAPMALAGMALAASFFLSGCGAKDTGVEAAPTVAVQVDAAESEAIQRKVTADAILYPLDQAAIVPKIAAPVKKFYVDRGSPVHAGQLLAELESADLAAAVTDNQGGLTQAQATYDAALQKAQQDSQLTKEELDAAQRLYDSRQALYKQGAVSAKDVDDARVSLMQAQDQYRAAQKQLDLKVAEGQLNSAKGKSAAAEAQLSYTKIVSPIDGVVTDRPVYPGEMPASGAPLITVMDLSQVIARAHVSQQDAAQIKVGDAATISAPGVTPAIQGKVTLVSPALDPNSTTVEVWVQAPNPKGQLKPGGERARDDRDRDGAEGDRDSGRGPADRLGRRNFGDDAGHRQQASQAESQSRHSQRRRHADHRRAERRRARGHRGSVRARQRGRRRLAKTNDSGAGAEGSRRGRR